MWTCRLASAVSGYLCEGGFEGDSLVSSHPPTSCALQPLSGTVQYACLEMHTPSSMTCLRRRRYQACLVDYFPFAVPLPAPLVM